MNTYYEKSLLLYPAYLGYMGYYDEFFFLIMIYIVYNILFTYVYFVLCMGDKDTFITLLRICSVFFLIRFSFRG